ncbi:MAG: hypothetical protein AB7E34_09595 [Acidaminococcaceae bacterium]
MQIYDCTLCLLPDNFNRELFVELYQSLCQLPVIVEYPTVMEELLQEGNSLSDNSKAINVLPPQETMKTPCFGETKESDNRILFPFDDLGIAGAIALREIEADGEVRTAFGGLHNTAATEEILMALYVTGRLSQKTTEFSILPKIAALLQNITGKKIPAHKSVTGSEIFAVESGIHVDGILKNPELYEPFPPEIVGMKRKIVLGSHSGHVSIREKLKEYNIYCSEGMIDGLLTYVQTEGRHLKRHLTDEEFLTALGEEYEKRSSYS